MKYQSLLIITYGRSGSTLLQGIVNSIDGVVVRGENYDFCWGLYTAWKSLALANEKWGGEDSKVTTNSWFGADKLNPDLFIENISQVVSSQLLADDTAGTTCYGFKEIRYLHHLDELIPFLNFLGQIFPNPAFIFNTRAHRAVCNSAFWKKENSQQLTEKLKRADRLFFEFAEKNPNAFIMHYENIIKGPAAIKPLFDFLGAPFNSEVIQQTLETAHSFVPMPETLLQAKTKQEIYCRDNNFTDEMSGAIEGIRKDSLSANHTIDADLLLISMIKDEIDKLPWFIDYYRSLGCRAFLFIDSGSTDGSIEFLRQQNDVILYHSNPDLFRTFRSGRIWVNFLAKKYAMHKWVLCADADELLSWPGDREEGLTGLIRRAERLGLNRVFTPMIDAYSDKPTQEMDAYVPGQPFGDICPWIDPITTTRYSWDKGMFSLYSGPRSRFADSNEKPPLMSKQSLYFVEPDGYEHLGPHFDNYGEPSPLVAPFLHYKFLPDFDQRCKKNIRESQHWNNAQEYKNYMRQELPAKSLKLADSVHITSGHDLHHHIAALSRLIMQNIQVGSSHLRIRFTSKK